MRVAGVKISHFRGIENCEFVLDEADSVVCLIGKGDSTKSTILNAIRWALAPSWSLSVEDQDFFQCDVGKPIVIEVAVRGLPDELISISKFGLFLTDKPGFEGATDPVGSGRQPCITIRLTVADDLDPVWEVYKDDRAKRIGAGDRSLLGVSAIFSTSDSSFTWARGSGLRRLLADEKEISAVAVNALRRLNGMEGSALINQSLLCLEDDLKELGVLLEADNLSARALVHRSKLGIPLALFDGMTPVELKGAGTRKLVDAAVGMGVTEIGAVLVIDEIETGLEPHRLRGLLRGLRKKAESEGGQVIITTHSPVAITELDEFEIAAVHSTDGVTSVRKMATRACGDELVRRKLKACAEAFLAKSVIVCEGKTELGIVRALEEAGRAHLSLRGVAPVDANGGAEMFKLARLMNSCGYRTCVFMDSDESKYDGDKKALRSEGIQVFDWDEGMSTELQVFNDVPDETVRDLISLAVEEWDAGRVRNSLDRNGLSYDDAVNPKRDLTPEERRRIGAAAQASGGGKPWFKRIDLGEKLGKIVLGVLKSIPGSRTETTLDGLVQWVEEE